MSNGSPTAFLVWALLASLAGLPFPFITAPVELWHLSHRHTLLSLFFVFSIGWALELVTHFEGKPRLSDAGCRSLVDVQNWLSGFSSLTKGQQNVNGLAVGNTGCGILIDAWIFLVGSLGSTTTNVAFLYVLARFPTFLRHVKLEGAQPDVVVRLATFYELNLLRVIFRFMSGISLLVLAADGIQGSHSINKSFVLFLDLLLMLAAIGQFVSSAITILIFFPRSFTTESGYCNKAPSTTTRSISSFPLPTFPGSPKSPEPVSVRRSVLSNPTIPSPNTGDMFMQRHPHDQNADVGVDVLDAADGTSDEPVPGYHASYDHSHQSSPMSYPGPPHPARTSPSRRLTPHSTI
ncbi:hypothetical protein EVG20_g6696, partial [Dentipellis fragilis]